MHAAQLVSVSLMLCDTDVLFYESFIVFKGSSSLMIQYKKLSWCVVNKWNNIFELILHLK